MPESSLKSEAVLAPTAPLASGPVAPGTSTLTVLEALAAIWDDSRTAPATYLDDTVVPHGGE